MIPCLLQALFVIIIVFLSNEMLMYYSLGQYSTGRFMKTKCIIFM